VIVEEGGSVNIAGGIPKVPKDTGQDDDDDDDTQPPDDDDDTSNNDSGSGAAVIVIIIVVLLFLVAGGVGAFIYLKGKQEEDEEGSDGEDKECPNCNVKMEYNEDFNRFKCPECGRYQR
jgi:hypothetical protein